jgi:dimethylglycine dehydrogenase
MEVYGNEYAMHFPRHEWPAARNKKVSQVHERIVELGGQMGVYNGWERANWFAKAGNDTSEEATQTWGRAGPWQPRIREDARRCVTASACWTCRGSRVSTSRVPVRPKPCAG